MPRTGPTGRLEYTGTEDSDEKHIYRTVDVKVYGRAEQDMQEILTDALNVVQAIEHGREKSRKLAAIDNLLIRRWW